MFPRFSDNALWLEEWTMALMDMFARVARGHIGYEFMIVNGGREVGYGGGDEVSPSL